MQTSSQGQDLEQCLKERIAQRMEANKSYLKVLLSRKARISNNPGEMNKEIAKVEGYIRLQERMLSLPQIQSQPALPAKRD
jgi:uncharacterized protein YfcZ (UPF0381/DUF406 family)